AGQSHSWVPPYTGTRAKAAPTRRRRRGTRSLRFQACFSGFVRNNTRALRSRVRTKKYDSILDETNLWESAGGKPRVCGLVRVIRAAHEGARLDVDKSQIEGDLFQRPEFVGMVVANHRRVLGRRPKILADGEDLAAGLMQIPERCDKFVVFLAKSYHQPRF